MKEYFKRLLGYDQYANLQLLDALNKASQPPQAVKLMAHMLKAQQVWLARCEHTPPAGSTLWPDWDAVQFKYIIEENSKGWMNYIEELNNDDFDQVLNYTNFSGLACQDKITDILGHLINHGTHHRAQIGQELKRAGLESLPVTDYIFYVRSLKQ
jgi:uncharacterized damage-inducible protein DinB